MVLSDSHDHGSAGRVPKSSGFTIYGVIYAFKTNFWDRNFGPTVEKPNENQGFWLQTFQKPEGIKCFRLKAQGLGPWAQGLGPWALGPVRRYALVISNFGLAVGAGQKACLLQGTPFSQT